jgi:hypothetical protein
MPPGWSHTGDHKTAKLIRNEFLKNETPTEIKAMQSQDEITV